MDKEIIRDWKFWVSLGSGFVAGAVVALLYAPMEGAEMRRRTGELASNVASSAAGATTKVAAAAQKSVAVYGSAARNAGSQIDRLFTAVAAGVDEANRVRDDYKKKSEALKNNSI
ncbi:MAG: YtxH domain-containing protein [bacterium]